MKPEDRQYLEERAEQEIRMAQEAQHAAAVRAHYLLAGFYLDKVHGDGSEFEPTQDGSRESAAR